MVEREQMQSSRGTAGTRLLALAIVHVLPCCRTAGGAFNMTSLSSSKPGDPIYYWPAAQVLCSLYHMEADSLRLIEMLTG